MQPVPYGLVSPTDAYAQGLRKMRMLPPLTSEFVGMASYAPNTFHEFLDDEAESEAPSSTMWRLATVRPGSALWRTLRDNHQW